MQSNKRTPPLSGASKEPLLELNIDTLLDEYFVKMYYNGYTDHIAGVTSHAEAVKNNWKKEAKAKLQQHIQVECLKARIDELQNVRLMNGWHVGDWEESIKDRIVSLTLQLKERGASHD